MTKLCLFCKHIHYEKGFAYSEDTWNPGHIKCNLDLWDTSYEHMVVTDDPIENLEFLFPYILQAETCEKYQVSENLKDKLIQIGN